jgi:glycosyltransferase involved in cell wall biosynthesis
VRVLHLPTAVGNHGYSLACAERRKGLESTSLVVGSNAFRMAADEHTELPKGVVNRTLRLAAIFLARRSSYDVFHFNSGRTLLDYPVHGLDYLDLPFYRGARFVTFNGSDARQSMPVAHNPHSPFHTNEYATLSDTVKARRLKSILKYVNYAFVLNPDLMNFLPHEKSMFLPYIKQSWFDKVDSKRLRSGKEFVIVHAPTNRRIKGTDIIIQQVNALREHYPVRLILVEGVSHEEAKKSYLQADLLIDQIRLGWYGGVAVEAMRMGVPVAVYINPADLKFVPDAMREAIPGAFLGVDSMNLFERVAELIENPRRYSQLVSAARDYVNRFHDPDRLVKLVIDKYEEFGGARCLM